MKTTYNMVKWKAQYVKLYIYHYYNHVKKKPLEEIYQKLPVYVIVIIGDLSYFFLLSKFSIMWLHHLWYEKILIFKKLIYVMKSPNHSIIKGFYVVLFVFYS